MSLANALSRLSSVGEHDALVRDALLVLVERRGAWTSAEMLASRLRRSPAVADAVLKAMYAGFMLDCDGAAPAGYRLRHDPVVRREIDVFLRHAKTRSAKLQANVARFRRRHDAR